jgi:hypothetical protein
MQGLLRHGRATAAENGTRAEMSQVGPYVDLSARQCDHSDSSRPGTCGDLRRHQFRRSVRLRGRGAGPPVAPATRPKRLRTVARSRLTDASCQPPNIEAFFRSVSR